MTFGDERRWRIDDTFAEILAMQPHEIQRIGWNLPHQLGLVSDGEGWEDFIVTDVNRDLPRYACEGLTHAIARQQLQDFRKAHHAAVLYGLVVDRVADGQRQSSPTLEHFRRAFGRAWFESLAMAIGDRTQARVYITRALRALARGNRREQRALARASKVRAELSAAEYTEFTLDKLLWFGTSADALLQTEAGEARAAFRRAYDTFSIALQCIDDALDAPSDETVRGASFPRALGIPPGALLAAAPELMKRAAALAEAAGLRSFAHWLGQVGRAFSARIVPGDPLQVGLGAALICAAAERTVHV